MRDDVWYVARVSTFNLGFLIRFFVMAIGAPFFVIETVLTAVRLTRRAWLQANAAIMLITAFAARDTFTAKTAGAAWAIEVAVAANCSPAFLTARSVIFADGRAAIGALEAVPVREGDERASRVVGPEQVGDDHEEIQ